MNHPRGLSGMLLLSLLTQVSCAQPASSGASGQPGAEKPPAAPPLDWKTLEAPLLTHQVELTSREQFVKAGEAYFSPDGKSIIFQAVAAPEKDKEADPFYAMYVAKLQRDRFTDEVTGLTDITRISPEHSANTCGWFDPAQPGHVIFGSTLVQPADEQKSGFQVGSRVYKWMFPKEMEVVAATLPPKFTGKGTPEAAVHPVFSRPNYDAECSLSKDGRFLLYAHLNDTVEGQKNDADIWVYDTKTQQQHCIVKAPGYDGGPFFSPDNKSICYRSDRKGDDLLQLFVADLKFDKDGVPVGIEHEHQLTENQSVNWGPFWHPSGKFLIYASSEISHYNYELFAIQVDMAALRAGAKPAEIPHRRITSADGADVLPAFSPDGTMMMWTSQRGPKVENEEKSSSQLWIAQWKGDPFANASPKSGPQ